MELIQKEINGTKVTLEVIHQGDRAIIVRASGLLGITNITTVAEDPDFYDQGIYTDILIDEKPFLSVGNNVGELFENKTLSEFKIRVIFRESNNIFILRCERSNFS